METEKETLERLKREILHKETNLNLSEADSNQKYTNPTHSSAPTIRTLESDIVKAIDQDKITQISTLSKQLDAFDNSDIYAAAQNIDNRKKYTLIFLGVFFVILCSGFSYYYYNNIYKIPVKVDVVAEIKIYNIENIWKAAPQDLVKNTGLATNTKDVIILDIKNFDELYYYVSSNEFIFDSLAKDVFNYKEIKNFTSFSVENKDLRIADGEEGPVIYGFFKKEKLIITNSLQGWLTAYKNLSKKE